MMDGGYIDGQMIMIQRIKGAKPVKQTNMGTQFSVAIQQNQNNMYITCLWEKKNQMCSDETKDA